MKFDASQVLRLLGQGLADSAVCRELKLRPLDIEQAIGSYLSATEQYPEQIDPQLERALRIRAERQRCDIEAQLRAMIEVLPMAVLTVDGMSGEIKSFNSVACEYFGYTPEQLKGLSVESLVHPEHRGIHPAYRIGFLMNVRKRMKGYHPPILGLRRDGSLIEMSVALSSAQSDDVTVVCSALNGLGSQASPSKLDAVS